MVFSSLTFLCCSLPLVIALYFVLPRAARNGWLLIFSLLFYAWGEPVYIVLMLGSIKVNWLAARLMDGRSGTARRFIMGAAAAIDLSLLVVFKYSALLVQTANQLTGLMLPVPQISLPIGISFYTFQALSYVIDVYRGDVPAQRHFSKVALYISLFPQLIAGPIVRYMDIAEQIDDRTCTWDGFALGMRRFVVGLSKKVLIANVLAPVADEAFAMVGLPVGQAWLGLLCYALQIYFDFSGYSDMAIGLGRIFGFRFSENFDYPYIARSMREFWNRWHISLSTWFRDYLYIPLGGNRAGRARQILNIAIVFLLTGLWHGASWSFAAWGAYHGLFRIIEVPAGRRAREGVLNWMATMLIVLLGWVLFRADTLTDALTYMGALFGAGGLGMLTTATPRVLVALAAGIIGATPAPASLATRLNGRLSIIKDTGMIALLLLVLMALASDAYNPFIYFRF